MTRPPSSTTTSSSSPSSATLECWTLSGSGKRLTCLIQSVYWATSSLVSGHSKRSYTHIIPKLNALAINTQKFSNWPFSHSFFRVTRFMSLQESFWPNTSAWQVVVETPSLQTPNRQPVSSSPRSKSPRLSGRSGGQRCSSDTQSLSHSRFGDASTSPQRLSSSRRSGEASASGGISSD